MKLPSVYELAPLFFNEKDCISYFLEKEVFYQEQLCPNYGTQMKLYIDAGQLKCPKRVCRRSCSIRKSSFFSHINFHAPRYCFSGSCGLTRHLSLLLSLFRVMVLVECPIFTLTLVSWLLIALSWKTC